MLTIDKIEGNSGIGCPVYSRFAQMQNYNFLVLSPVKELHGDRNRQPEPLIDQEHEKFQFSNNNGEVTANDPQAEQAIQVMVRISNQFLVMLFCSD